MKIYLAGSIPKGDEEAKVDEDWRERYKSVLQKFFVADFIDPSDRDIDENDLWGAFGFDCQHIKDSSLVIVNAEERLGVGTSQELIIAKYFKKPVITVLPKSSQHRRFNVYWHGIMVKDWIHPFIQAFSDFIVETVNEIELIKGQVFAAKIKDISLIDDAVKYIEDK